MAGEGGRGDRREWWGDGERAGEQVQVALHWHEVQLMMREGYEWRVCLLPMSFVRPALLAFSALTTVLAVCTPATVLAEIALTTVLADSCTHRTPCTESADDRARILMPPPHSLH